MSCIPNNREELQNRVQNKKAVFNTSASQTQQDTIGHLEYLQDNFVVFPLEEKTNKRSSLLVVPNQDDEME